MKAVAKKSFLLKILFLFIAGFLFCTPSRVSAAVVVGPTDVVYKMSSNELVEGGRKFDENGVVYETHSNGTAECIKCQNINKTVVDIDLKVTVNGVKYTVTSIAANAFKNNRNLKEVTIPASVKKIGKQAFYNCQNLKRIEIKSKTLTKNTVGENAFGKLAKNATVWIPACKINVYRRFGEMLKAKGFTGYLKILSGGNTVPEEENTPPQKKQQTITVNRTIVKTYRQGEMFSLGARAAGKLTYKISNPGVAVVSASGVVKITGYGAAVITINAAATTEYEAAVETVQLTVVPGKVQLISVISNKKGYLEFRWERNSQVSGYEISYSTNKTFDPTTTTTGTAKNNLTGGSVSGLVSGQIYFARIRGFVLVDGIKNYGPWSAVKYCRVK